jgi:transcription initiation factor TFIID TATA-box-binding protein
MSKNGCYLRLKNTICTFDFGRPLNLTTIAAALGARYDPGVFPAAVSRCRQTHTTSIIFGTGNVVVVGCCSQDNGLEAAYRLLDALLRFCHINLNVYSFRVSNMVCSIELDWALSLDLLYADCKVDPRTEPPNNRGEGGLSYEPEAFPGMSWPIRLRDGLVVTVVLFKSGNGVATQIGSQAQMHELNSLLFDLQKYEPGSEYRELEEYEQHTRKGGSSSSRKRKAAARCDNGPSLKRVHV